MFDVGLGIKGEFEYLMLGECCVEKFFVVEIVELMRGDCGGVLELRGVWEGGKGGVDCVCCCWIDICCIVRNILVKC